MSQVEKRVLAEYILWSGLHQERVNIDPRHRIKLDDVGKVIQGRGGLASANVRVKVTKAMVGMTPRQVFLNHQATKMKRFYGQSLVTRSGEPARPEAFSVEEYLAKLGPDGIVPFVRGIARTSHGAAAVAAVARELALNTAPRVRADDPDTAALAELVGEVLSSEQVAGRLGQSRQNVNDLTKRGRLLGLRHGSRWKYPAFQFRDREILPGLPNVLQSIGHVDPWDAVAILVQPGNEPGGCPIALLRQGDRAGALGLATRRAAILKQPGQDGRVWMSLNADLQADLEADRAADFAARRQPA